MSESEFRAIREQVLLRLLLRTTRAMTVETVTRMQARNVVGMQPAYPRFLGNLDTDGTRLSALARRMGVSRQAVAQLVVEIEKAGFVTRAPDPDDGRGVIVSFTKKGREALGIAVEVMTAIEQDYAAIISPSGLSDLKGMLKAVLDKTDKSTEFGLD